jgi:hypothetical protein
MKTIQLLGVAFFCAIFAPTLHAQNSSQVTLGGVTYTSALSCSDWDKWADNQAKGDASKAAKIKKDLNCQETQGRSTITLPNCADAFVKKNNGNKAIMEQLVLDAVSFSAKFFCVKYTLVAESQAQPVKPKPAPK